MARFGKGKGVRLNYQQSKLVEDTIRAHASVGEGTTVADKLVVYETGWDDRKVAEELRPRIGEDLTASAVRRFRATNIGRITPGVKPGTKPARAPLQEQIAVLTQRIDALEAYVRLHAPETAHAHFNAADVAAANSTNETRPYLDR